jgi:hypothetical protein
VPALVKSKFSPEFMYLWKFSMNIPASLFAVASKFFLSARAFRGLRERSGDSIITVTSRRYNFPLVLASAHMLDLPSSLTQLACFDVFCC